MTQIIQLLLEVTHQTPQADPGLGYFGELLAWLCVLGLSNHLEYSATLTLKSSSQTLPEDHREKQVYPFPLLSLISIVKLEILP
jgi:hypothetical protein